MSAASVVAPSAAAAPSAAPEPINTDPIEYMQYAGERQLQGIIDLISVDLSEPYSVFTYRYFINNWPNLCYLAVVPAKAEADAEGPAREERVVGCIVCKQDAHRTTHAMRGYIAMLAVRASPAGRRTRLLGHRRAASPVHPVRCAASQVHNSMRKRGMGSKLVSLAVQAMHDNGCEEAVLETEVTNIGALRLYESLGFVRDKRLHKYYLNGNDAYRLKVWFPNHREG
jgi:peptide alpha-N-acetyltransferase